MPKVARKGTPASWEGFHNGRRRVSRYAYVQTGRYCSYRSADQRGIPCGTDTGPTIRRCQYASASATRRLATVRTGSRRRTSRGLTPLRGPITSYDAWYVAVAEALELPHATVD